MGRRPTGALVLGRAQTEGQGEAPDHDISLSEVRIPRIVREPGELTRLDHCFLSSIVQMSL